MYETPKEKEDRLYKESRSLKFQAREMRKKRIEKEAAEAARLKARQVERESIAKRAKEVLTEQAKTDRDNRIRKALLQMSATVKENKLAFEGPDDGAWRWSTSASTKDAFYLIDRITGDKVLIKTRNDGFQWD